MARRKSGFKGFAIIGGLIFGGAYFSKQIMELVHKVAPGIKGAK